MPFGLKIRFWARTSLMISAAILVAYLYLVLPVRKQVLQQKLDAWDTIASQIIRNVVDQPQIFQDLTGTSQASLHVLLNSYITDRSSELYEIAVLDTAGLIIGHSVWEKTFSQYEMPRTVYEEPDMHNLTYYDLLIEETGLTTQIYDYKVDIRLRDSERPIGELHLRIYKSYIDEMIAARRWEYTRLAILAMLTSSAGLFLLIYLILNPLRKLAEWVRSAGSGEIEDEIDIDPSTEVGEIAKAFTEITSKFRESQKNLAEQERLQKEMQVAQEIQQTLLPHEFPDIEGYEIAGHYEAAQLIGGDYYDFVEVDRDTLGIVVADVSGKGVPGSMVMTMIRQALRTEARGVKDAAEVLARLNELILGDMKKGMFVTMFYVIIDSKRRRLNYASAGHNPMILYRASTQKTYYLNPRGFPIGIQLTEPDLFRKSIESDTLQLAEDDLLLLYTDGITEAMNSRRQIFGEERLLQAIRQLGHLRAQPFVEALRNEILAFTEECPQSDDITFVVIREKTTAQKEEFRRACEAYRMIMAGTSIRQACETAGISTFVYYNKYKREFEEVGIDNFAIEPSVSVEAKHIAIEDKAKIFDIIKNHPEYGAKRISDELNTEKYGYTQISESKIYEELVRLRLNTRQLREAFVARGARRANRPIKPPGTPMLTLDGRVILDQDVHLTKPAPITFDLDAGKIRTDKPAAEAEETPATAEARHEPEPEQRPQPVTSEPQPVTEETQSDVAETPVGEEPVAEAADLSPADAAEESGPPEHTELETAFADMIGESNAILEEDAAPEPEKDESAASAKGLEEHEEFGAQDIVDAFGADSASSLITEATHAEDATDETAMATDAEPRAAMPIADIDELLQKDGFQVSHLTSDEEGEGVEAGGASSSTLRQAVLGFEQDDETQLDAKEQMLIEGFRLYKKKQYDEAIVAFKRIIDLYPDYKEAYRILANAYFRRGDFDKAAETYEYIKTLDPSDTFAYENMGIVYTKQGQYEEALLEWQKLLEIDPQRDDIRHKIEIFTEKLKS
ncbi:MAG: SpoIIE family protein phosphatase [candidate division KSB1 bacterium]|nr:SpoIIE family protein phosphatase [candidate division KSB1 bacterium]